MGRYFVKVLSLVMVFVMLVGLAACGPGSAPASNTNTNNQTPAQQGNEASGQSNAASNQGENTAAQTGNEASNQPGGEPSDQVEEKPDNSVTVTKVEELLDAIKPDANIILAKGTYNLSETLKKIKESGYREWQQSHPYTWIQDRYDGPELIIQSANGLVLKGQTEDFSDTQLVTDPRYANVLYIQDCTNVTISNMTLGHTIAAECKGSVIFLENTKNTILDNVDLYGCGVRA